MTTSTSPPVNDTINWILARLGNNATRLFRAKRSAQHMSEFFERNGNAEFAMYMRNVEGHIGEALGQCNASIKYVRDHSASLSIHIELARRKRRRSKEVSAK